MYYRFTTILFCFLFSHSALSQSTLGLKQCVEATQALDFYVNAELGRIDGLEGQDDRASEVAQSQRTQLNHIKEQFTLGRCMLGEDASIFACFASQSHDLIHCL